MKLYLSFFGFTIPSYGFCIALGIVLSNLLALIIAKKKGLSSDDLLLIECYSALGMIFFAKLLYIIVSIKYIDFSRLLEPEYLLMLIRGGFVFYGGLFGAFIGAFLVRKIHKVDIGKYLNNFMYMIPLAHAFGRIGCFMAGCCYGAPYSGRLAVVFPQGSFAPAGVPLFPIQLVESVCLFLLATVLFILSYKGKEKGNILMYLAAYSLIRFVLEYYRYDAVRGIVWIFSVSQWISIVIWVILFLLLYEKSRSNYRSKNSK